MIELIELRKYYSEKGMPQLVLKGINLLVQRGEIFGVIGKSGAGKSTLLRCINSLEKPSAGDVVINGHYLNRLEPTLLRHALRQLGTVFQNYQLVSSLTISENIALPLRLVNESSQVIKTQVHYLLELVDLTAYANYFPAALSGGQKQRVAIARALASQPKVLLVDEGTSALDPKTTQSILTLLRTINQSMQLTIFLITHEMQIIKSLCDRVALLDQGQIIEQSDVLTFFTQPSTSLAKELTQLCLGHPLPPRLMATLSPTRLRSDDYPLLRLFFYGKAAQEPLITRLVLDFQLEVNILQGSIEFIKDQPIGIMTIAVVGHEDQLPLGIHFLENHNVHVEVIGYVSRSIPITS
jgi:D-methionine transport system ATP-binding protein